MGVVNFWGYMTLFLSRCFTAGDRACAIVCASVVLLIGLTSSASCEKLKIGFIVPLSGPAAIMGESLTGVIKLTSAKNLEFIVEDDRCEGKFALSAYQKLQGQGIKVFYMACSGSILAVAPKAREHGTLIVTSYAGSTQIRGTGSEVIRFNPDAVSVAHRLVDLLSPELTPAVILHEEQDYAQSLANTLSELAPGTVVEKIPYRTDASTFNSEILRAKQRKPRSIILIPTNDAPARQLLRQLANLHVSVPIIGEVNVCDYPFKPSDFGLHGFCVSANFQGAEFQKFIEQFRAAVGHAPTYPFYDAIALDILTQIDLIASQGTTAVSDIKQILLASFNGRFTKYTLSPEGEVLNGREYLSTREY